ncbi:MAG TPA: C40 family peptidase [Burkholderiaceae bacterium]|jgi:hypothetical protein|nr:C40 family peptidase [Burkholderiaceae bacterium]
MTKTALFAACLACALSINAHAAPSDATDDLDHMLEQRGLVGQLQQLGYQAKEKTSSLVMHAMGFLGLPYRRGGNSAETGFDCSGFVRAMYSQTVGLLLPRQANEQAAVTQTISRDELRPGDLVFFNTMRRAFSHVGIYIGEGKFIHSPRAGREIRVDSMQGKYWVNRFDGARRVTSAQAATEPR